MNQEVNSKDEEKSINDVINNEEIRNVKTSLNVSMAFENTETPRKENDE